MEIKRYNENSILSFFEVNGEKLEKVDPEILKKLWIEKLDNILKTYKQYIEENLQNLPKEQIDKVKLSIIRKFNSLKLNDFLKKKKIEIQEKILDIKQEIEEKKHLLETKIQLLEEQHKIRHNTLSLQRLKEVKAELRELENTYIPKLKDFRWEINEEITSKLDFVTNELLPSLAFYSKNYDIIKQYNDTKDNAFLYKIAWNDMYELEDKIEEINELLKAQIDEEGNFDEWFFSTQNILSSENDLDKRILEWVKLPGWISILSEKDKEIQAKAMAMYISYVLVMIIPYAWDLASLPADVRDLITNQEWTLTQLKSMWLVPQEFTMKKEMWDHIFWWVWILASIASLVPLISVAGQWVKEVLKSEKLAKAYKMVSRLWISKERFSKMLEESADILKNTLKDGLYTLWTNMQKHPVGKQVIANNYFVDNGEEVFPNSFTKIKKEIFSDDEIKSLFNQDEYKFFKTLDNETQVKVIKLKKIWYYIKSSNYKELKKLSYQDIDAIIKLKQLWLDISYDDFIWRSNILELFSWDDIESVATKYKDEIFWLNDIVLRLLFLDTKNWKSLNQRKLDFLVNSWWYERLLDMLQDGNIKGLIFDKDVSISLDTISYFIKSDHSLITLLLPLAKHYPELFGKIKTEYVISVISEWYIENLLKLYKESPVIFSDISNKVKIFLDKVSKSKKSLSLLSKLQKANIGNIEKIITFLIHNKQKALHKLLFKIITLKELDLGINVNMFKTLEDFMDNNWKLKVEELKNNYRKILELNWHTQDFIDKKLKRYDNFIRTRNYNWLEKELWENIIMYFNRLYERKVKSKINWYIKSMGILVDKTKLEKEEFVEFFKILQSLEVNKEQGIMLLKKYLSWEFDNVRLLNQFNTPKNKEWLKTHLTIEQQKKWLYPSKKEFIVNIDNKIIKLSIEKELDPIKVTMMWNWVDNSCLSFYYWDTSESWSVITNAIDVNKWIFWIKWNDWEIIWRVLVFIDDNWNIWRWKMYYKGNLGRTLNVDKYFNDYLNELVESGNFWKNWDEQQVLLIEWEDWYKDGVVKF